MFAILGNKPAAHQGPHKGVIHSMEGNCYIATTLDEHGHIIEKAEHSFACISQARDWLKEHGTDVCDIEFKQSGVYSEMIGYQGFN